jgi:prophage regulatory protein
MIVTHKEKLSINRKTLASLTISSDHISMYKQVAHHLKKRAGASDPDGDMRSAGGRDAGDRVDRLDQFSLDRVLRTAEVVTRTSPSRAQLYRMMAQGSFPARIKLSSRHSGWLAADVQAWLDQRRQESLKTS